MDCAEAAKGVGLIGVVDESGKPVPGTNIYVSVFKYYSIIDIILMAQKSNPN